MKIIIEESLKVQNETPLSSPRKKCLRLQNYRQQLTPGRILAISFTIFLIICGFLLFKTYIKLLLIWLERQDSLLIAAVICSLFVVVSLPISIGYIVLVLSSGYLFGFAKGLPIVIFGANLGLLIAHNLLRAVGHHPRLQKLTQNETALAIMQVISGPLCFKIVLCSRLTPIPFGLQNTIFALSNVNAKVYHTASFFGLLPAQFVAVYVGSTLRSMQDVLEHHGLSTTTYIVAGIQVMLAASLIIWIGTKARLELLKALQEAETVSVKTNSSYMV